MAEFRHDIFKKNLDATLAFLGKSVPVRCARTRTRNGLFPEIPENHEDTTIKKQINPSIKAHLLWSAPTIRFVGPLFLDLCSKNSQLRLAAFRDKIMQRLGFPLIGLIVFGGVAPGLGALASASNLPEQKIISHHASLQPTAATHETRAASQGVIEFPNPNEIAPRIETDSSAPPTRSSFMATWGNVSGAKGYFLDVSTSNSFSSYVDGYHGLNVGNVNGRAVIGLNPGTTYYYRVSPYTAAGSGGYSNVTTATTQAATGLIINPTFDSSIINDPNSAAIQAMINRAIGIYESRFRDPITIQILFLYSTTAPNGDPLPPDVLAASLSAMYNIPWNDFIGALRADATTTNDNRANASLPGSPLSTNIVSSGGNGRAVGLNTPPAVFSDGTIGQGGPYDGIVMLNSAQPFQFTRPPSSGSFDAQTGTEHEIDEIMGLGSQLNIPRPPSCTSSDEAESPNNTLAGSAVIQSCPTCSGGFKVGYVGSNSGTLQFNGVSANAPGANTVTIWYTNGDSVRYALLSVNGSQGTPLSFPSTGSFQTVGSIQTTITLNAGNNNTLTFYNPIAGNWAPDFDRIGVNCVTPPRNLRPQDLFSWSSAGVRNLTSKGSRYFSIDSGSTNIVGFNQTSPGDFGDWLSEACPQTHPYVQNAFGCPGQFSDISATSPEGINLDVIGYDLVHAIVSTAPATNVASFSATLNGTVDPEGLAATVHFQYGTTTNYGSVTANQNYSGNTTQNVSANISGLTASTTYHFRIVATTSTATTYGSDRTFTTLSTTGAPVVTTNPATYIASFSATLNGTVDPHALTTSVHFQYGPTTSYGFTTAPQSHSGNTYLNVSANISSLTASTTYHFRVVASNSAGTRFGNDRTFTTLTATGPPVVTTNPATNVSSSSATLNGSLDPHGLTTSVNFQYGTTISYGHTTTMQSQTGNTYRNITGNISGLTTHTTYHFRIVGTNSGGTRFGSDRTFTTP